jgi:hypothetical protein
MIDKQARNIIEAHKLCIVRANEMQYEDISTYTSENGNSSWIDHVLIDQLDKVDVKVLDDDDNDSDHRSLEIKLQKGFSQLTECV